MRGETSDGSIQKEVKVAFIETKSDSPARKKDAAR